MMSKLFNSTETKGFGARIERMVLKSLTRSRRKGY